MSFQQGFKFKQFTVKDDQCQMKVGTDGVLLGAWVDVGGSPHILDVGTGSGLIALMLAQRTSKGTVIDAVEPSGPDASQARDNVSASRWADRINVHECKLQDFTPSSRYDLIVSNPPYFSASLLPPASGRANARHTISLSHGDLLRSATRLLKENGKLALVLPATEGEQFVKEAASHDLGVARSLAFHTRQEKKLKRWLFELSKGHHQPSREAVILYSGTGQKWSPAYHALVKDFYLDQK